MAVSVQVLVRLFLLAKEFQMLAQESLPHGLALKKPPALPHNAQPEYPQCPVPPLAPSAPLLPLPLLQQVLPVPPLACPYPLVAQMLVGWPPVKREPCPTTTGRPLA